MGRRYYCEYCDKSFIDELYSRKRHLTSNHHLKMKKLYYEQCRDLQTLYYEESEKTPCHRYLNFGDCQFQEFCKYTHYPKEVLWGMKQQIIYEEQKKRQTNVVIPSLESWVEEFNAKHNKDEANHNQKLISWDYPEQLECRTDLPPSLKKIKAEDFDDSDFEEWG